MHVHLFNSRDLLLYVANGVTTIRNLGGYGAADSILRLREEVRSGARLGPTIFTSGNWLDGDPPFRPINTVVRTPAEAARLVSEQREAGYDFVKVYENLSPEVYLAVLAAARANGIAVTGHVPRSVALEDVLAGGQVAIDHLGQFQVAGPFPGDEQAHRTLDEMVRLTREHDVSVTSTLVMLERASSMRGDADYLRRLLDSKEARYLSPDTRAFWGRAPFLGLPPSRPRLGPLRAGERTAVALAAGGSRLLLGTDAGLWGNPPGFSTLEELELLVQAGLTPADALRAGITAPAAFLNEHVPGAAQPGEIAAGARADLVLLEENPRKNVRAMRRRAGVILRGRWLPEAELRDSLERLAADYAR
jgi:imidazolonepropionase-like amidohydrolase